MRVPLDNIYIYGNECGKINRYKDAESENESESKKT